MPPWYRGIAVGGSGPSPADVHDFGPGMYFSDSDAVAGQYGKFRSEQFNDANERTTAMPAVLYGEFGETELGRTLDLTQGRYGQAWRDFEQEGSIEGVAPLPGWTKKDIMTKNPPKYGEFFREFLTRQGININEYSAYIGPEYIRGGRQLCIRNQAVADRVSAKLVGRSIYAPAPIGAPPEVITVTPGRGQANAAAVLGAFQVVAFFVNYINDKLQGQRAQQALKQAAFEIAAWQTTTPSDGALISISYGRKELNDPTGVVRRSSFVQAGDTFYGMQVDYGPTYEQAINHKRQIGTMWPELPEESPYKLEYRTSLYWIKPRLGYAPLTELKSPVGWWFVRVKPSFSWYYQFSADGTVTWTDPGNSRTGKGRWKMGTVYMDIEWESKSSEKWTLPLHPVGQAGNCLWTNGLQDLRADFGVTPPGHVANPPPNSPVGTWNVRIGKARFRYTYRFDAAGNVRWTDIFSGMTGVGRWKFADDYLVVTWASGSKEHWDTPLDPKNSTGSAQITGEGTLDLRADRV